MKQTHRLVITLAFTFFTQSVLASDAVTDAIQRAYQPYREALYLTNKKAQQESEKAITQAKQLWADVVQRYAAGPPVPYDRDEKFSAITKEVAAVLEKASQEISEKALAKAHDTLEDARDLISELRKRNGVVVFSDHMNAYHEEMEHILNDGEKTLSGSQGFLQLMAQAGKLEYLAERLGTQAPQSLANNIEFQKMLLAVKDSVKTLQAAILKQKVEEVRDALNNLKKPYSQMFNKFG